MLALPFRYCGTVEFVQQRKILRERKQETKLISWGYKFRSERLLASCVGNKQHVPFTVSLNTSRFSHWSLRPPGRPVHLLWCTVISAKGCMARDLALRIILSLPHVIGCDTHLFTARTEGNGILLDWVVTKWDRLHASTCVTSWRHSLIWDY